MILTDILYFRRGRNNKPYSKSIRRKISRYNRQCRRNNNDITITIADMLNYAYGKKY